MKIIISPAKKMNVNMDCLEICGLPEFLKDAEILMEEIRALNFSEAKQLWKCNDKLAELNYRRFQEMDLKHALTPAVLAYEGLQYQHMAPTVFTKKALSYIEEHLRILSGFYGLLRPFDGVTPYRLEMHAKLSVGGCRDLYDFWGKRLYKSMMDEDRVIVNLASGEYAKCIEPYIAPHDRWITIEFGELIGGKLRQKGTLVKMARGEMVRFLAENHIDDLEDIRKFHEMGFSYSKELSGKGKYVFVM